MIYLYLRNLNADNVLLVTMLSKIIRYLNKYLLESFEFSNLFETPLIVGGGA